MLQDAAYMEDDKAINNPSYENKAEARRRTVGSDFPHQKDDVPASVNRCV